MKNPMRNNLAVLAFLGLGLGMTLLPAVHGAEIPADLDQRCSVPSQAEGSAILEQAGLPVEDARAQSASLDPVELAELERSGAAQQEGAGEDGNWNAEAAGWFGSLGGVQVLLLLLML